MLDRCDEEAGREDQPILQPLTFNDVNPRSNSIGCSDFMST